MHALLPAVHERRCPVWSEHQWATLKASSLVLQITAKSLNWLRIVSHLFTLTFPALEMICRLSFSCFSHRSGFSFIFCGSSHAKFLTSVYFRGHFSSSFVTAVTRNSLVSVLTVRTSCSETFFLTLSSESCLSATNPMLIREGSL